MNKKRISQLESLIVYHKKRYYRGEAEISDGEYDLLEDELRTLAPESYALQVVGSPVKDQKIPHDRPMLSLDKRREPSEVVDWMDGEECMVTDKMDGSSASLVFVKGGFRLAKTRGDGTYGENISRHFKYIDFPEILSDERWRGQDVEIRGEVCISKEAFEELCDEMVARRFDRPSSIRNIVAGLLHKKEDLDLCRHLDFIAYEVIRREDFLQTEVEKFELLHEEGFNTPTRTLVCSAGEFLGVIEAYQAKLETFPYLTDGLVIAVNDLKAQAARGFTGHHPKGKLAFKFKSDLRETVLRQIIVDVGRTGRLTFVGVVDPVVLSGATVQRVTLNNAKYIRDNDLNTGCRIEITRSGEVIPKHERTVMTNGEYVFPETCPLCDTVLISSDTGVDLLCSNPDCRSRRLGRIANWIDVLQIENIGDETLSKLFEKKMIQEVADLYRLTVDDMLKVEGFREKSATRVIDSIARTKVIPLEKFLTALGIPGLGKGIARLIVSENPTLQGLSKVTREGLLAIGGIGEVLADSILKGLVEVAWPLVERLSESGVKIVDGEVPTGGSKAGKTFVITGTLSRPRKEIQSYIEERGGKVTGQVSRTTSYLVCNEASESAKYRKAVDLGVPVITETELFTD